MLDFSKITDFLTEMAGNALQGVSVAPEGLLDQLASVGLDPSALAGLSEEEIGTLLSSYDIDVSALLPEDLAKVFGGLGLEGGAGLLQGLSEKSGQS